jgi:hypothetical protein
MHENENENRHPTQFTQNAPHRLLNLVQSWQTRMQRLIAAFSTVPKTKLPIDPF